MGEAAEGTGVVSVRQKAAKARRRERAWAERWLAVVVALGAVMALPARADCPPRVPAAACAEQARCVAEVYRPRPAEEGVSAREAALVARLDAERACALAGWALALKRAEAVAATSSTAPSCPPCLTAAPAPDLVDQLVLPAGACALGCGLVAGGIAAGVAVACGGGP